MMQYVTLVDHNGTPTGTAEKIRAHHGQGILHLAFSIFVFNQADELLLQKRADGKYHFAGLWSNSCCGHPLPEEAVKDAAQRRLQEELGFTTQLTQRCTLVYEAHDQVSGLSEKEFLHVLTGEYSAAPSPADDEVSDWRWQSLKSLGQELKDHPEHFTPWFRILMERIESKVFIRRTAFNE